MSEQEEQLPGILDRPRVYNTSLPEVLYADPNGTTRLRKLSRQDVEELTPLMDELLTDNHQALIGVSKINAPGTGYAARYIEQAIDSNYRSQYGVWHEGELMGLIDISTYYTTRIDLYTPEDPAYLEPMMSAVWAILDAAFVERAADKVYITVAGENRIPDTICKALGMYERCEPIDNTLTGYRVLYYGITAEQYYGTQELVQ